MKIENKMAEGSVDRPEISRVESQRAVEKEKGAGDIFVRRSINLQREAIRLGFGTATDFTAAIASVCDKVCDSILCDSITCDGNTCDSICSAVCDKICDQICDEIS